MYLIVLLELIYETNFVPQKFMIPRVNPPLPSPPATMTVRVVAENVFMQKCTLLFRRDFYKQRKNSSHRYFFFESGVGDNQQIKLGFISKRMEANSPMMARLTSLVRPCKLNSISIKEQ